MVHSYTPTYYTSLHDSITSICKNIFPFSFKKRRLTALAAAEQRQEKQQSDNLKWQQESFHQILNLMGLCKEGILHENEVSAFRTHLLETLIASPIDHEAAAILRDKLIFLQELLYANCISEDEYHTSKRPLLQRLAVQGAVIGARDVIVGGQTEISNQEWSIIDLKEDNKLKQASSLKKIIRGPNSSVSGFTTPDNKLKQASSLKKIIKGPNSSVSGFTTPDNKDKNNILRPRELLCSTENPFWNCDVNEKQSGSKSILMMAEKKSGSEKVKRKPFTTLIQRDQKEENVKTVKKTWGFDGFKKWKKNEIEDETAPLSFIEKSDDAIYSGATRTNPSNQIKKQLHPTDFLVDEVSGENIQKEISRVQTELCIKSQQTQLSSRCDRPEDTEELRNSVNTVSAKQNSKRWTTFDDDDDDENSHPNLFAPVQDQARSFSSSKINARSSLNNSSIDKGFKYNPFFDM